MFSRRATFIGVQCFFFPSNGKIFKTLTYLPVNKHWRARSFCRVKNIYFRINLKINLDPINYRIIRVPTAPPSQFASLTNNYEVNPLLPREIVYIREYTSGNLCKNQSQGYCVQMTLNKSFALSLAENLAPTLRLFWLQRQPMLNPTDKPWRIFSKITQSLLPASEFEREKQRYKR